MRFPPGRVAISLDAAHRSAYRALYARYRTVTGSLPVFRERDFDGRKLLVTRPELDALNRAFASLSAVPSGPPTVFEGQERSRKRLAKKTQYLS